MMDRRWRPHERRRSPPASPTRAAFDRLLGELRPKLHRYCARMTGSVIDGEDVVQEAIVKAIEAFPAAGSITNAESWLIRIAHNAALDFLRRRARQEAIRSDEDPDMIIDPVAAVNDRQIVAASLRTFMRLPVAQRSSVILMDVLGYSLDEISSIMDTAFRPSRRRCIAAVSACASSHRSLTNSRSQSWRSPSARARRLCRPLQRARFRRTAHMLADEVRLDLVNRLHAGGPTESAILSTVARRPAPGDPLPDSSRDIRRSSC